MFKTNCPDKLLHEGWALLPLRIILGFGFAAHGYAKLNRGPEIFATILHPIGVPHPVAMAWMTSLVEFLGGICLIGGAFVLPLSLPLTAIMLTAMVTVHWPYGFSSVRLQAITNEGAKFGPIGYEMNLLYIAGLITLALGGSGALSVDRYISRKTRERQELISVESSSD